MVNRDGAGFVASRINGSKRFDIALNARMSVCNETRTPAHFPTPSR